MIETDLSSALIAIKLVILQRTAEASKKIKFLQILQTRKACRALTEYMNS